jgi:hypothetical protein
MVRTTISEIRISACLLPPNVLTIESIILGHTPYVLSLSNEIIIDFFILKISANAKIALID